MPPGTRMMSDGRLHRKQTNQNFACLQQRRILNAFFYGKVTVHIIFSVFPQSHCNFQAHSRSFSGHVARAKKAWTVISFWHVNCVATNQMRDGTAREANKRSLSISHETTPHTFLISLEKNRHTASSVLNFYWFFFHAKIGGRGSRGLLQFTTLTGLFSSHRALTVDLKFAYIILTAMMLALLIGAGASMKECLLSQIRVGVFYSWFFDHVEYAVLNTSLLKIAQISTLLSQIERLN